MKSMTGYGLGKVQTSAIQIEASLRAVNGRFLEVRFHLPKEYLVFEAELKKLLQKYFERGTIDLFVGRKENPANQLKTVQVNKKVASQYHKAMKELGTSLKISAPIHLETIARFPDVLFVDQKPAAVEKEKQHLLSAVKAACLACEEERKREGLSIRKDLESILKLLSAQVETIRECRETANQGLEEKFHQKIKSKLAGLDLDAQRIAQEVVIQLEKSDINEELSRLQEHLKHYRLIFNEAGGLGKKLDFYTQELLREVNTIGSKSNVSKLTQSVVEAKALIEKLREQVQNIE